MAEPVPISLGRGSNKGRHGLEGIASLVNCYVEHLGEGGKVEWPIYAINGLDSFGDELTNGGEIRGMLTVDSQVLIVSGRQLFATPAGGSPMTLIGGIPSDGFVTMARNRRTPSPDVVIVCDGQWFIYNGGTLTEGSDSDLPPPIAVVEIDGYFVFVIADGRWFISAIDDTTIDGLDFTEAQSSPDRNVMAAVRGRELIIFGDRSMEWYRDDAASADFPFSRVQTARIGCYAAGSVQQIILQPQSGSAVDSVIWAATDSEGTYNGIRVLDGYSGTRISTPEVDRLLRSESDPASLRSMAWTEDGHAFYAISGASFTKVFDTAFIGQPDAGWHDRKSAGIDRWRAQCHAQIGQEHLFGDYADNLLYLSNPDTYDEAGDPIVTEVVTPPVHAFPNPFVLDALFIDALTGVGVVTPIEDSYTKLLLHFDDRDGVVTFADSSSSPKTFTANGNAQIDTAQSKFGGASLLCDGTGDYVTTPDHADFNLGSGDWTIDCWFNCVATTGTLAFMAGQSDNAATASTLSFWIARETNDKIRILGYTNAGANQWLARTSNLYTDLVNPGWHHLAVVKSGAALNIYVDGVLDVEASTPPTGTHVDSSNNFSVGRLGEFTTQSWNGWIDEFRLSVGIARWTAAFDPPQNAYTNLVEPADDEDSNPVLMLDYSDDGGSSFGGLREIELGEEAQRHVTIKETDFGEFGVNGVSLRIRCSARVVKGLLSASTSVSKLAA